MKYVKYVHEYEIDPFSYTLQNALNELEAADFHIVSVHPLSNSLGVNGYSHSAYIVYEQAIKFHFSPLRAEDATPQDLKS
jgi:hypothetical protein